MGITTNLKKVLKKMAEKVRSRKVRTRGLTFTKVGRKWNPKKKLTEW